MFYAIYIEIITCQCFIYDYIIKLNYGDTEKEYCILNFNLSKKEARDVNDQDLGKVLEVDYNYALIEKPWETSYNDGRFYIPMYLLEKYDENTLWFRIDQEEAKNNFTIYSQPLSNLVKACK